MDESIKLKMRPLQRLQRPLREDPGQTVGEFFRMSRNKTLSLEADEDLAYLLTHIGEDNMIMGSDYGHQDQSKEDGMVGVMRRKKSISPAVIEKILCDNPRRFYGL